MSAAVPMTLACNHPLGFSTTCHECAWAARSVRRTWLVLTEGGWSAFFPLIPSPSTPTPDARA